ncbi:mechanosensitive ion channel family protein [Actinocorallia sp. A-T 12471]|uniref:mechanosensitive ion channel family protein n=1 Tax=Actinocorallia sp. A-T 12471 TaxID=3089813 RepID=UPI0029D3A7D4|nr:mechanosensitive ion channel family protein [Actinocorallia sp. A-T 12471]MDX6740132.1 mechanosensitive ion channel family protein [Actinocorallia sp. A-T 12471]
MSAGERSRVPESLTWDQSLLAGAAVAGMFVVGLGLRLLMRLLSPRAAHTRWAWDDLVVRLMADLAIIACLAGGVWIAVLVVDFTPDAQRTVGRSLIAVLILAVSLATARLAGGLATAIALARSGVAQSVTIFANISRAVVLVLGTLVLLQSLGVSITPMLTALGVGGLAVALALQDTLANLFAGVHILASKTIEPGDFVQLSTGQEGNVVDINWRKTTIRTITDNLVIVPNARFADAILTNFHQPGQEMDLLLQAKVGYRSDLAHVERVTLEVAAAVMAEVEGGIPGYDALVRFHTFGEHSIDFTVVLRAREFNDQFLVKHEFVKRLHARFRAEHIEIPLPTRHLVFADAPPVPPRTQFRGRRTGTGPRSW